MTTAPDHAGCHRDLHSGMTPAAFAVAVSALPDQVDAVRHLWSALPTYLRRGDAALADLRDGVAGKGGLVTARSFDAHVKTLRDRRAAAKGRQEPADDTDDAPAPGPMIPMSRGDWSYSLGTAEYPRGVYARAATTAPWRMVGPLPRVECRVVRRSGDRRRTGLDYLVTRDDHRTLASATDLRMGEWAAKLDMVLSDDDRVVRAVATAIKMVGDTAPEVESTPRFVDGRMSALTPDTLPAGYLMRDRQVDQDTALAAWGGVAHIVARVPQSALLLGAAMIAPFVGRIGSGYRSHVVNPYGDHSQGKTTILRVCSALWGMPDVEGNPNGRNGTMTTWNVSGKGRVVVGRILGSLAYLPAFFDETGTTQLTPREAGEWIYSTTEGGSRQTSGRDGKVLQSPPWHGIVFITGNGRLTAGIGAGSAAGIPRRVVELSAPFTACEQDADQLDTLVWDIYGHPGRAVLDRYSVSDVQSVVTQVSGRFPWPDKDAHYARAVTRHLVLHCAGAALADELFGTGTVLFDAAMSAAITHLTEHCAEPDHDADRLLSAVREAAVSHPAAYPTPDQYAATTQIMSMHPLPEHGIERRSEGLSMPDGYALFPITFHALAERLGIDESVALRELDKRGRLSVAPSLRRRGKFQTTTKLAGHSTSVYRFVVADDDQDDDTPLTAPVLPADSAGSDGPVRPVRPAAATSATAATPADPVTPAAPEPARVPAARSTGPAGSRTELTEFTRAIRRYVFGDRPGETPTDVDPADAAAALEAFHQATGGLEWRGWSADTAHSLYAWGLAKNGTAARGQASERLDSEQVRAFSDDLRGNTLYLDYVDPAVVPQVGQHITQMDVHGQFLAAADVTLGTGEPTLLRSVSDVRMVVKVPGYVRLAADVDSPVPAFAGRLVAGAVVTTTQAGYLIKRGATLPASEALVWAAGNSRQHLRTWKGTLSAGWYALQGRTDLPAVWALRILKSVYTTVLGGWLRSDQVNADMARLDWSDMIVTEAGVRALVALDKATDAGRPAVGMRRDSAWFLDNHAPSVPAGMSTETKLGKWKADRWAAVTQDMVAAHTAGSFDDLNKAIKAAHESERESGQ